MQINYSGPLKRMMELKELAEKKNDEQAQFQLAELYEKTKNYKEAAKWYRQYAQMRIQWRNERLGW